MPKRQGITAKDIADACNVSQATVSYVINQTAGKRVSETKRQEILQMAKELNYFPNRSAKSMRQRNCTSIGLVCCNNYANSGLGTAIHGIKIPLDEAGYTITILNDANYKDCNEVIKHYYSNSIAGVIYLAFDTQYIDMSPLDEKNIPYAVISENGVRCSHFEPQAAFVSVIRDCIRFCRDNGLSRIRYFSRSINGQVFTNKYTPLVNAVQEIYPEADFQRIICDVKTWAEEEFTVPIQEYLSSNDFDIVITSNQHIGILMQNCILKQGFTVPQKPLHICLSSSPFLMNLYPRVSSLRIPMYEMGLYASELLLALIHELPVEEKHFSCQLIHGDTTVV